MCTFFSSSQESVEDKKVKTVSLWVDIKELFSLILTYKLKLCCFLVFKVFFVLFWQYKGLNSSLTFEPLRQPCFVLGFFKIGSQELFVQG
jgi:hypothetical protein